MDSLVIITGTGVLSLVTAALLRRYLLTAGRSLMCRLEDRRCLRPLMRTWPRKTWPQRGRIAQALIALTSLGAAQAFAQPPEEAAGEAN